MLLRGRAVGWDSWVGRLDSGRDQAIGAEECQVVLIPFRQCPRPEILARRDVPQSSRRVLAPREDRLAVRAECHAEDGVSVARERLDRLPKAHGL
jgi:hypothetical protein